MSKVSRIRACTDAWVPDFSEALTQPSRVEGSRLLARQGDPAPGLVEQSAPTPGALATHSRLLAANGSTRRAS